MLYCATTNPGKLREFRLAAGLGLGITPLNLAGIPAPEETGVTFEENAIQKALYYAPHAPGPLFAEDSGLEVTALGGAPGVYSARYSGLQTGPQATGDANNQLLISQLNGVADRRAKYVCALAIVFNGQVQGVFRGEMEGEMLERARGTGGFGYDPFFYYPPFGQTLAEVPVERTFEVSHRRRALDQLFAWWRSAPKF